MNELTNKPAGCRSKLPISKMITVIISRKPTAENKSDKAYFEFQTALEARQFIFQNKLLERVINII